MRAMAITGFGGPERLRPMDLERPVAGPGEVLVRVVAAGVNPIDWKIREGRLAGKVPHRLPIVPGCDVAGVVEELGRGAARFRKGDRVWGVVRKETLERGCYAEYVTVAEPALAAMPRRLLFEEAAGIPLAGTTAAAAVRSGPGLGPRSSVLVHAAAGGVGHLAIQLARAAGAAPIGTASAANHAFLLDLGATAAIDYTREDFRDAVRRICPDGVDLVVDLVGGDTLARSFDVVKPGGRVVSTVDEPDPARAASASVCAEKLDVAPDAVVLDEVGRELDARRLKTHVQKIYPLARAAEAQETSRAGHVRGKLVLNL
jgi:NADPH2:quinone reductase